jgi:prepilin-type N-terminal cleavage/methylation domain-containing protein
MRTGPQQPPGHRCSQRRRHQGLTLLELLIALVILALLLGLGVPSFSSLLAENRGRAAMSQMRALFAFARQQALTTGQRTTVCAVRRDGRCIRDWLADHEIVVFVDIDENRRLDASDRLLRRIAWPVTQAELSWRASLGRPQLTFEPSGATWQNGTLFYCPSSRDARHARALVISQTGRSYMPGDSNGDGIREDRSGNNLTCS